MNVLLMLACRRMERLSDAPKTGGQDHIANSKSIAHSGLGPFAIRNAAPHMDTGPTQQILRQQLAHVHRAAFPCGQIDGLDQSKGLQVVAA